MSSISLKNCELAQKFALYFYVFLKTHALAVQFSMIDSLVLVLADSLYIIPHVLPFVKGFFKSFFIFSKKLFSTPRRTFRSAVSVSLSRQPVYYTTNFSFCQEVFQKFFGILKVFFETLHAVLPIKTFSSLSSFEGYLQS